MQREPTTQLGALATSSGFSMLLWSTPPRIPVKGIRARSRCPSKELGCRDLDIQVMLHGEGIG